MQTINHLLWPFAPPGKKHLANKRLRYLARLIDSQCSHKPVGHKIRLIQPFIKYNHLLLGLIIKGAVVGILVIAIVLLARNSESSIAAILIHIPVFSLGAFWVASSISRESAKDICTDINH